MLYTRVPSVAGPLAVTALLLARVQVAAHHGRLGSRHHLKPRVALGLCVVALYSAFEDATLARVEAKAVP